MTGALTKLSLCACLLLTFGSAGAAAEDEYAAIRETLELCFGCHGQSGASEQPKYPILAGQHLHYIYVQLKDFKAGRRENEEMKDPVAKLDKQKMLVLAKFFSEQKWPNTGYRADPVKARKGETAAAAGQCVQCHRGGYEGDSRIPRVAGQHVAYLEKTMLDFKIRARNNSAAKSSLMDSFNGEDIAGMAEFMGGM